MRRPLRAAVGSTDVRRSLHTTDLLEAQALKFAVVADIKAQLARATAAGGKLDRDAPEIRREIQKAREDGSEALEDVYTTLAHDRAERLAERIGTRQASRFYGLATASQEPLQALAERWLSSRSCRSAGPTVSAPRPSPPASTP